MRTIASREAVEERPGREGGDQRVGLRVLVGRGDKITLFVLPFVVAGASLNIAYPSLFSVGGPPAALRILSISVLAVGLIVWAWSVALILRKVPRGELITSGPFSIVKHPLYTSVALLVLPWVGFLFDSWLGAAIGIAMYVGTRIFARAEEAELATRFGDEWNAYERRVRLPWL